MNIQNCKSLLWYLFVIVEITNSSYWICSLTQRLQSFPLLLRCCDKLLQMQCKHLEVLLTIKFILLNYWWELQINMRTTTAIEFSCCCLRCSVKEFFYCAHKIVPNALVESWRNFVPRKVIRLLRLVVVIATVIVGLPPDPLVRYSVYFRFPTHSL